ncbi:glutamate receptor ionotropic, kainate 2 [Caerostris extrusa]|uniref:Glutamate receptor ionotropic, kainate 2 n=1 Tax=Caerostris extrusa TaxID=172846 RepID=A0AAV4XHB4_CAEEX|nr:glutamate receptor ionotropic, kainate 2 [Caerostris extrusa]
MFPARFPASWIVKMRSAFLRCWDKLNEFWEDGEFWDDEYHGRHESPLVGFSASRKILMVFDDESSTKEFFQKSTMVTYKRMEKCADEECVNSNHEGIEKVKQDDYAYFMETTSIENNTERECNITMIGGPLDNKCYGIAVEKGK